MIWNWAPRGSWTFSQGVAYLDGPGDERFKVSRELQGNQLVQSSKVNDLVNNWTSNLTYIHESPGGLWSDQKPLTVEVKRFTELQIGGSQAPSAVVHASVCSARCEMMKATLECLLGKGAGQDALHMGQKRLSNCSYLQKSALVEILRVEFEQNRK